MSFMMPNYKDTITIKQSDPYAPPRVGVSVGLRGGDTNALRTFSSTHLFACPVSRLNPTALPFNKRKKIPILLVAKVKSRT